MQEGDAFRLEERAQHLLKMVEEEGPLSVAKREDLDYIDRSLLEMLARLDPSEEGFADVLGTLESRAAEDPPLERKAYTIRVDSGTLGDQPTLEGRDQHADGGGPVEAGT